MIKGNNENAVKKNVVSLISRYLIIRNNENNPEEVLNPEIDNENMLKTYR